PISRISAMIATIERGVLVTSSASSAPTPAAGRVDRIVTAWIRLSYNMPSTRYTATIAPTSRSGIIAICCSKRRKKSPKPSLMSPGMRMSEMVLRICCIASPMLAPGARLNDSDMLVIWLMCWIWLGAMVDSWCAMALIGIILPLVDRTRIEFNAAGVAVCEGSAVSTTW
ncbi:hypothetical protein COL154_013958, partial [Colletotrichum chrysophilum]